MLATANRLFIFQLQLILHKKYGIICVYINRILIITELLVKSTTINLQGVLEMQLKESGEMYLETIYILN
ncbi:MAG: hypothetical protein ACI4HN_05760, partial [Ruminococcus sp.]